MASLSGEKKRAGSSRRGQTRTTGVSETEQDRPLPLQRWPELELEETLGSHVWDVEGSLRLLDSEKHRREGVNLLLLPGARVHLPG